MGEIRIQEIEEKLNLLAESFAKFLYEEDEKFLKNMESKNLAGDDIRRYAHWEWTQGVGLFGYWNLFAYTKQPKYLNLLTDYYNRQMEIGLPHMNVNTAAPLLALSYLAEYTKKQDYMELCIQKAEWILNCFPRTKEGGFQHITSDSENNGELWDDTLFMTVLFLANIGRITKKKEYIEEAEYQFLLHAKYLTDKKTGLWYHGWTFCGEHNFAGALWGRGNCWVTASIPLFLEMDTNCPASIRRYLTGILERQAAALKQYQDVSGMWHTLVDDSSSYVEASATCGFAFGILRAVRMGLLPSEYMECAQKAAAAILVCIEKDGTVGQVSYGTPMGRESKDFYKQIEIKPMPYGQALAMLFLLEYKKIRKNVERRLILFWDSGDTLVEEVTEKRDDRNIVTSACLHTGCKELLLKLKSEGFRMALVADGEVESFQNIYQEHGLKDVFEVRAVSEALPERKPAAVMFQTALDGLGLSEKDKPRIVMIGNHLMRDIAGANRFGIHSVLFGWTTRYRKEPENQDEVPEYTVTTAEELYALIHKLESVF